MCWRKCCLALALMSTGTRGVPEFFEGTYNGPGGRFKGFKPDNESAPVFIYVEGTETDYWNDAARDAVNQMALRGFLAASVKYDDGFDDAPEDFCDLASKANNIFRGGESALGRICSMSEADCSRGVAVSGHSQGGFIAMFSDKSDARVTALLPLATGMCSDSKPDHDRNCMCYASGDCLGNEAMSRNGLPRSKRRYVAAEDDLIVGGGNKGGHYLREMKQVSGYDCGDENDCIQADGSGYFMMTSGSYNRSGCDTAPHSFWTEKDAADGGELLCATLSESAKWGLPASFDWLAGAAMTSGPPPFDAAAGVPPPSCRDACPQAEVDLCELLNWITVALIVAGSCCCCCCCCCAVAAGIFFVMRKRRRAASDKEESPPVGQVVGVQHPE